MSIKGRDDKQENKFFLRHVKGSTRGRYTRKPRKPRRSNKFEEVHADASSLLSKKTSIDKSESIGILSNDRESTTSVDPQDQTVLSAPQDVEDRQAQSQGRRLDAAALQAFKDRCDATNIPGLSGSDAYVDCDGGFVSGDTSTSCKDACAGQCCTGTDACAGFTGKGKQRVILIM